MSTERAGSQHNAAARRGGPWLCSVLVSSARSDSRTKTHLGARYCRLAATRGGNQTFVAVGHALPGTVHAILPNGEPFHDLGATDLDRRDADHLTRRPTRLPLRCWRAPATCPPPVIGGDPSYRRAGHSRDPAGGLGQPAACRPRRTRLACCARTA